LSASTKTKFFEAIMTYDAKQIALNNFRKAWNDVTRGFDYSPAVLLHQIKEAGGMQALGIDPEQLDDLNRRGAINLARSAVEGLEKTAYSSPAFEVHRRRFREAVGRAGGLDAIEAAGITRERLAALGKNFPYLNPRYAENRPVRSFGSVGGKTCILAICGRRFSRVSKVLISAVPSPKGFTSFGHKATLTLQSLFEGIYE
jgi:hypothetical protein